MSSSALVPTGTAIRIGMLTPSSNTVLEPVTYRLLHELPEVTAHFSRFGVTEIGVSARALRQFDIDKLLAAAELLVDARVHVIAWNGTSAGWLGFESDRDLCRRIREETGIPATTSVLALAELLRLARISNLALVTPYTSDVQARILKNFEMEGYNCIAERHLGISENFAFSQVAKPDLIAMIHAVAASQPQAITSFCTNLAAAPLAACLESELGIPIYDTAAVTVWHSVLMAGGDPSRIKGWGRLFGQRSD